MMHTHFDIEPTLFSLLSVNLSHAHIYSFVGRSAATRVYQVLLHFSVCAVVLQLTVTYHTHARPLSGDTRICLWQSYGLSVHQRHGKGRLIPLVYQPDDIGYTRR